MKTTYLFFFFSLLLTTNASATFTLPEKHTESVIKGININCIYVFVGFLSDQSAYFFQQNCPLDAKKYVRLSMFALTGIPITLSAINIKNNGFSFDLYLSYEVATTLYCVFSMCFTETFSRLRSDIQTIFLNEND